MVMLYQPAKPAIRYTFLKAYRSIICLEIVVFRMVAQISLSSNLLHLPCGVSVFLFLIYDSSFTTCTSSSSCVIVTTLYQPVCSTLAKSKNMKVVYIATNVLSFKNPEKMAPICLNVRKEVHFLLAYCHVLLVFSSITLTNLILLVIF